MTICSVDWWPVVSTAEGVYKAAQAMEHELSPTHISTPTHTLSWKIFSEKWQSTSDTLHTGGRLAKCDTTFRSRLHPRLVYAGSPSEVYQPLNQTQSIWLLYRATSCILQLQQHRSYHRQRVVDVQPTGRRLSTRPRALTYNQTAIRSPVLLFNGLHHKSK